ncbi:MAG: energy transducer TonB, partial [Calditrichaeota bacterium]|nr:energy transducer TonB [Calditrichota bacterium]
ATDIQVLKGHPALNEAAINAVSHYEFSPAIVAGKRVPVKWQIPIRFRIES